jgi:hypothetical protein
MSNNQIDINYNHTSNITQLEATIEKKQFVMKHHLEIDHDQQSTINQLE